MVNLVVGRAGEDHQWSLEMVSEVVAQKSWSGSIAGFSRYVDKEGVRGR